MRCRFLPLVFGVLLALPAWAEEPPGIVMAIAGDTNPPLSPMAEIPANTPVRLQADAKLTFLHYGLCKLVTVTGGTLTLTRADYKEDGGAKSETDGPCPRVQTLSDAGQGRTTGGIVARGLGMPPRWPISPEIVFTGTRGGAVTQAVILADGQPPRPLDMTGARATAPKEAPPLSPNGHYTLRLTMRDRRDPVDVSFIATNPTGAGALVVLRMD